MGAFAPVMQFETLHTLLAIPTVKGWHLCQMVVKRSIFIEDGIGQVCRLAKSIYGCKQAGITISMAQC
jgi:hypothetical protein